MKQRFSLILALLMLASAVSCGDATVEPSETTTGGETTTEAETTPEYTFADVNLGGAKLPVLNSSTNWGFYTTIDLDEATGESLDDAVFARNSKLEEKFNFEFDVTEADITETIDMMQKAVLSGDDVYKAGFLRGEYLSPLISDGMLVNLNSLDSLDLDREWWDQNIRTAASVGDGAALYIAGTDFSLMGFGGTIGTFFNKNMLGDLGGASPYQLVRDGKWTLDELAKYAKLGANLNGAENFTFEKDGKAKYGLVTWYSGVTAMVLGSGEEYLKRDKNNMPYLAVENDRFYSVCSKIASLTATEGEFGDFNDRTVGKHYEMVFAAGRALMCIAELKASNNFREMTDNFGILPIPKYDEAQEKYVCLRSPATIYLCMPVTNQNKEETAAVLDAATYLSYRDVLPIYYNVTVAQKGLRDEESIEMLEIIQASRYFDAGRIYGWTTSLYDSVENSLRVGDGDLASTVATYKDQIKTKIADSWEKLAGK